LNALRSQLLTNGAPAGATIKKVSNGDHSKSET